MEVTVLLLGVLGALAVELPGPLALSYDSAHRFYIENEVHLPNYVMLYREINGQARIVALQTQVVLSCEPVAERRRGWEVHCHIDDLSLIGASPVADRGDLGEVLLETDERLTGAVLQIQVRTDGHITNVDLEGVDRRNRRVSSNAETLRLLLVRSLAGLDLQLPSNGTDDVWSQRGGLLMMAPYAKGSQGSGEMIHRVKRVDGDVVVIETAGRGIVAPATDMSTGPSNLYETQLESMSRFDVSAGQLVQRRWTSVGTPTASSQMANGTQGVPYLQAGTLVALGPEDELPILRQTGEVAAPGATPSAIQQEWTPIMPMPETR